MAKLHDFPTERLDQIVVIAGYRFPVRPSDNRDYQTLCSLCLVSKTGNSMAIRQLYQTY